MLPLCDSIMDDLNFLFACSFLYIKNGQWGWPRGRVVKFARSAVGGPVFRWFESWTRTWHCSSDHAEAASHMPQLEGPTTKNIQPCTGGLWGEKGNKIKSLKKKNSLSEYTDQPHFFGWFRRCHSLDAPWSF